MCYRVLRCYSVLGFILSCPPPLCEINTGLSSEEAVCVKDSGLHSQTIDTIIFLHV